MEYRSASFLIPVIDKTIWLGQRVKPPYAGFYGAIGGKPEQRQNGLHNKPRLLETIGGGFKVSGIDRLVEQRGLEYTAETAVREFCEEAFSHRPYPDSFQASDFSNVTYLGGANDTFENNTISCMFHLARVNRRDFTLNERELSDFKPLHQLEQDQIYPLTQLALLHLHWVLKNKETLPPEMYQGYEELQIPLFPNIPYRACSLVGALLSFHERGL